MWSMRSTARLLPKERLEYFWDYPSQMLEGTPLEGWEGLAFESHDIFIARVCFSKNLTSYLLNDPITSNALV